MRRASACVIVRIYIVYILITWYNVSMIETSFFRDKTESGFIAMWDRIVPCPPRTVARVALQERVRPDKLVFPEGFTKEDLASIQAAIEQSGEPIAITDSQADGLRDLGQQILKLDANGQVEPPLNGIETRATQLLVDVVTAAEPQQV